MAIEQMNYKKKKKPIWRTLKKFKSTNSRPYLLSDKENSWG